MILNLQNIYKDYQQDKLVVPVLKDVCLTVEEGEYVAIMGPSGSGKTTLLNMLSTIDRVTAGHIYYGETDITELSDEALAEFRKDNLGFIFQDYNLLDTLTIEENIVLAMTLHSKSKREIQEKCDHILKLLDIEEIRDKFPYQVSGGQKQRLCIARALIGKAKILIFDDSTSAVDTATEKKIREALAARKDVTKIIIAQRVTSVMNTDQIIILDDGKVHRIGTHAELLADDPIYQEIYASQMKGGDENGSESL